MKYIVIVLVNFAICKKKQFLREEQKNVLGTSSTVVDSGYFKIIILLTKNVFT